MGALLGGPYISPSTCGVRIDTTEEKSVCNESSLAGDSSKGSKGGFRKGELWRLEALQAATKQNPCKQGASEPPVTWEEHLPPRSLSSENLEGLTEKVGTLGFQSLRKNRNGDARKRARKVRLAEAPTGNSNSSQPQPYQSNHKSCRSLLHLVPRGRLRKRQNENPVQLGRNLQKTKLESSESKGPLKGPGK